MRRIFIGWFVFLAVAQALSATAAPSIVQLSTPYPLLHSTVRFGGISYVPDSVAYGSVGTPIVIRGANFGSSGAVAFLGTNKTTTATLPYTSSDGISILLSIPVGATTGSLIVSTSVGSSNSAPLVVTAGTFNANCSVTVLPPAAPVIAGLTPSTGPSGTLVTITGSNFGVSADTVAIGGFVAQVVSWKANSILAWVPNSIPANTLVTVVVTVANQPSNAGAFSVTGTAAPDPTCQLTD